MPAKPIDNERRACDAVVRVLEERHGAVRANGRSPEDERVGPPIEYVFDLGERTYGLEHTVVEAFDGQIHKEVDFAAFVAPIVAALDHQMPRPGSYRLTVAIHPSKGLKPKRMAEAQAAIVAWVRAAGAEMHAECPDVPMRGRKPYGHESNRRGTVEGIDLHLHREVGWSLPEVAYGRIFCGRLAPPNYAVMQKPPLDPDVADLAPTSSALTGYDEQHLVTYLRLLDAAEDGANSAKVAALVLHIDSAREPDRARRAWESHLARARWMTEHGYRHLLRGGAAH